MRATRKVKTLTLALLLAGYATSTLAAEINLRVMETTDIHVNLLSYDYYKGKDVVDFGLDKTASLIHQARSEVTNSLLFDNGDLIQGNPLGDYMARERGLKLGETHPVYKAMNLLDYDAANIGNHEFNYGLEFLLTSLAGANFPYVSANVFHDNGNGEADLDKPYFQPYLILDRTFTDTDGQSHDLKVGVIGFVPPQIMQWDQSNLTGKVMAIDIVEAAERYIPKMKAEGADIIIAIPHSGISSAKRQGMESNVTAYLSQVEGIDALLFGHSHSVFPGKDYAGFPGADNDKGTLNGVPAVMPGFWGSHLGVIDLKLEEQNGQWVVADGRGEVRGIYKREGRNKVALVDSDPAIVAAVEEDHLGTIAYVNEAVGTTTAPINSFFALVQDDPSIQIVNNAQLMYAEKLLQGTEYDGLPILSAGAPFKVGGRGGIDYFTDMDAGKIAIKNVADLYIYPNTVRLVKLNGSQVKEWLERSAGQFNQIDPAATDVQPLHDPDFRSYNFDVIDGVSYQIDVSVPARYGSRGEVVSPDSHRIVNLTYQGKPIDPEQAFVVVTNNYRASGGGSFPALDGSTIIVEAPRANRQVLVDYIVTQDVINPSADSNWSFTDLPGDVVVSFESSPEAQAAAESSGIEYAGVKENGFGEYRLKL